MGLVGELSSSFDSSNRFDRLRDVVSLGLARVVALHRALRGPGRFRAPFPND